MLLHPTHSLISSHPSGLGVCLFNKYVPIKIAIKITSQIIAQIVIKQDCDSAIAHAIIRPVINAIGVPLKLSGTFAMSNLSRIVAKT